MNQIELKLQNRLISGKSTAVFNLLEIAQESERIMKAVTCTFRKLRFKSDMNPTYRKRFELQNIATLVSVSKSLWSRSLNPNEEKLIRLINISVRHLRSLEQASMKIHHTALDTNLTSNSHSLYQRSLQNQLLRTLKTLASIRTMMMSLELSLSEQLLPEKSLQWIGPGQKWWTNRIH